MTQCPSDNDLALMFQGELPLARTEAIQAHLDACPTCAALVSELFSVIPSARPKTPYERPAVSTVGRYVITNLIGSGAMGAVFEAWDPQLERKVAIKLLRPDRFAQPEERAAARARLLQEARALARLDHPNLLTVFDAGSYQSERIFLASAFIDGDPADIWTRDRPWHEIVACYEQACAGLAHAHQMGILHRDVKPQNILVDREGRVRVCDFGLAGADAAAHTREHAPTALVVTHTGAILGTPAYMAPEQLDGQPVDARADQFGLCASLHEAVYGFRPYAGTTLEELRHATRLGDLARPKSDEIPDALFDVLSRGLRPRASERFANMNALASALAQARVAPTPRPKPRRWPLLAAPLLAGTLAIGAYTLLLPAPTLESPPEAIPKRVAREQPKSAPAQDRPKVVTPTPDPKPAPAAPESPQRAKTKKKPRGTLASVQAACQAGLDRCSACFDAMLTYQKRARKMDKQHASLLGTAAACAYRQKRCKEAVAWAIQASEARNDAPSRKEASAYSIGSNFSTCPVGTYPSQPELRVHQLSGMLSQSARERRPKTCLRAWKRASTAGWPKDSLSASARSALGTSLERVATCLATSNQCTEAREAWGAMRALYPPLPTAAYERGLAQKLPTCITPSDSPNARVHRLSELLRRTEAGASKAKGCVSLWDRERAEAVALQGTLPANLSRTLDKTLTSWARCAAPARCETARDLLSLVSASRGSSKPRSVEERVALQVPSCLGAPSDARAAIFYAKGVLQRHQLDRAISTLETWAPRTPASEHDLLMRILGPMRNIALVQGKCALAERAHKLHQSTSRAPMSAEDWRRLKGTTSCK